MPVVQRCQSAYVVAKHRLDVKYLKYCCLDFFSYGSVRKTNLAFERKLNISLLS